MVLGCFCDGSSHALITSRMKRLYRLTNRVSTTLHSRFASVTRGGVTFLDGLGVQSDGLKFVEVATGAVADPTTRPLVLTRSLRVVTWRHFMLPVEGGIISRPPSDKSRTAKLASRLASVFSSRGTCDMEKPRDRASLRQVQLRE